MSVLGVEVPRRSAWWWAPAAVGVVALLARPWFLPASVAVEWRVAFFVALGAGGLAWQQNRSAYLRASKTRRFGTQNGGWALSLAVLGVGALAFTMGRVVVEVPVRPSALAVAVGLNALAAVAEEAFFRRYLYGLVVERHGAALAVAVTAGAFALVHVTVWGWWVLPLDLAAGLVLSWQRAATGRWSVPAATHVLANTLALL
jgi:membrane protease YdiL (CAAX protease family)